MKKAAYILMIISTVISAFAIIPMAWTIPMTLAAKKRINNPEPAIALGICTIIFMCWITGIIAGILLLIRGE